MGNQADVAGMAEAMRVLADGTRLRLLFLLAHGESNVGDLCDRLHCPQPTASHHLGILRMAHMVDRRRKGKCIYYRLSMPAAAPRSIHLTAGGATVTVSQAKGNQDAGPH